MNEIPAQSILIIGGSGVFGSRLAEGLVADGVDNIVIAGRTAATLRETASGIGCDWVKIDRNAPDLREVLSGLAPFVVIDAAGPFQSYDKGERYRLVRAALRAGAHYLDLSDDGAFTAGIGAVDALAQQAGRVAVSGASSVPAISASAVRALSQGLKRIDLIESAILPGNRAPRGRSVVSAILHQAGKPIPGGSERGWIGTTRVTLDVPGQPMITRLASPIGVPDLLLFPHRFKTHDIRFRAGLELPILHRGLGVVAHLVKFGLLRSGGVLLPIVLPLARLFERFGSDVGGMVVRLRGETTEGVATEREWVLMAAAGDGPHVPAIPCRVLVRKLLDAEPAPGARACLDDIGLGEIEGSAPERSLSFARRERDFQPVFKGALGKEFAGLPRQIQDLHDVRGSRFWKGQASVTRSRAFLARLAAWVFAFPPATDNVPIKVSMVRTGETEVWTRRFGEKAFHSALRADGTTKGRVWECFGPFEFAIDLKPGETTLGYPVTAGRFLKIPMPSALLPRSDATEAVDAEGRATFDVSLSFPLIGHIVRYRGWLVPAHPMSGDQDESVES